MHPSALGSRLTSVMQAERAQQVSQKRQAFTKHAFENGARCYRRKVHCPQPGVARAGLFGCFKAVQRHCSLGEHGTEGWGAEERPQW